MKREIIIEIFLIGFLFKAYGQERKEFKCGKRLVNHEALITHGYESKEGDWPWQAAIYHIKDQNILFKCGGSLISSNSILTAAHCVFELNRKIIPERISVQLGKHNLLKSGSNTMEFDVHRIFSHPDFNTTDLSNDIAIIRLSTEATFNDYVQPICLWYSKKVATTELTERLGTVIGWGVTETDKLSYILRQAEMPVVKLSTCLTSNREFYGHFLSDNNFCAGFRNGTSVCNGDSGGPLIFEEHGVYYIRGIVSLSQSRNHKNTCNSDEYVLFTNVAKYLPWIENLVSELKRPQSVIDAWPRLKTASGKEYVASTHSTSWYGAYEFCRLHQMQLATIQSEEENKSFFKLVDETDFEWFWISGNDLTTEGEFIWMSNGLPFTYTAWRKGEPNNDGPGEDCVQVNKSTDAGWNDHNCDVHFNFVCETIID